jgi:hypothetical protein
MNIFIVPSCIKSLVGKINYQDRYDQTLKTFDTVRKQVKDSVIIFCDSSIGGLDEEQKSVISSKVDHYIDFSNDSIAQQINQAGQKSIGESYLLGHSILYAKAHMDLNKEGRMFKLGGRCELLEEFTMDDYKDTSGKYVFKKRLNSWKDEQSQMGATHLLETRLYSWSLDMVDEYLSILDKNFALLNQGLDTEHAHFLNIPKEKLLEFEVLNVGAMIAGYTSSFYIKD